MTSKRGRPERTGTQRPKQDVFAWVRENPEIKASKLEERLKLKRESIIRDSGEEDIDNIYYVPSIQHIARNWLPEARESLVTQEVQELLKPYNPMTAFNNPYWLSNDSPYTFTLDDKAMLSDMYKLLQDFWFVPLGVYEEEFNVNVAMWLCIVARSQPKLDPMADTGGDLSNTASDGDSLIIPSSARHCNFIDTFLIANYLAKKYLVGLQAKSFPVSMPPTETVTKADLAYLQRLPYESRNDWLQWEELSRQGLVNQPQSHWYTFLQEIYSQADDSWFTDFPMNWASQTDNFQWLPPFQKARFILATILRIFVLEMNKKYKDDVNFMSPQDDVVKDKSWHLLDRCNDTIESIVGMAKEFVPQFITINDTDKKKESSKFKFNTAYIVRYVNLLPSLDKVHYSEEKVYTGMVTAKAKYIGYSLVPLRKFDWTKKEDYWFDGTDEVIVDIEIEADMMFEVISATAYYLPPESKK